MLDRNSLENFIDHYPLLAQIDSPADLREMDENQLPALADELRAFLLETVSITGGHLASGLGSIEITIALHYLFETPYDRLIWDVGHQCYPHKILTGRRELMPGLRQQGGLTHPVEPADPVGQLQHLLELADGVVVEGGQLLERGDPDLVQRAGVGHEA